MQNTNGTKQKGLTLIELIIALSIGLIVFCGTLFILVLGQRSMDRTMVQAGVQRNATYAMFTMKRSIRNGTKVELDDDSSGFTVYNDNGSIRFRFDEANKNLLYQIEGQDEKILLSGIVQDATFEVTEKSVTVGISLEQDSCSARLLSTTTIRNYKSQT